MRLQQKFRRPPGGPFDRLLSTTNVKPSLVEDPKFSKTQQKARLLAVDLLAKKVVARSRAFRNHHLVPVGATPWPSAS